MKEDGRGRERRGGERMGGEERGEKGEGREAKGGEGEGTGGFICILLADACRRWLKIRLILAQYNLHMYAVRSICMQYCQSEYSNLFHISNIVYTYQIRLM